MMGEVVTGVGEFDFDVLEKLFGIRVGDFVETSFSELFGVAAAAFRCVKIPEGVEADVKVEADGRRLRATFFNVAIGDAGSDPIKDLFALLRGEFCEG